MIPALAGAQIAGSLLGPLATGIFEMTQADKQAKEGKKLREGAKYIPKEPLRKEFPQKLQLDQMLAQNGLQGMDTLKANIDQAISGNVANINATGQSGAERLAGVTSAVNKGIDAVADLGIADAEARKAGKLNVGNTLWNIGQQQRALELERTRKVEQQLQAAAAMENAAVGNKDNAIKTITGGVGNAFSSGINTAINMDGQNSTAKLYEAYLKVMGGNPNGVSTLGQFANPNAVQTNKYGFWG